MVLPKPFLTFVCVAVRPRRRSCTSPPHRFAGWTWWHTTPCLRDTRGSPGRSTNRGWSPREGTGAPLIVPCLTVKCGRVLIDRLGKPHDSCLRLAWKWACVCGRYEYGSVFLWSWLSPHVLLIFRPSLSGPLIWGGWWPSEWISSYISAHIQPF